MGNSESSWDAPSVWRGLTDVQWAFAWFWSILEGWQNQWLLIDSVDFNDVDLEQDFVALNDWNFYSALCVCLFLWVWFLESCICVFCFWAHVTMGFAMSTLRFLVHFVSFYIGI